MCTIVQFFMVVNGQIMKNIKAIWSHCSGPHFPPLHSFRYYVNDFKKVRVCFWSSESYNLDLTRPIPASRSAADKKVIILNDKPCLKWVAMASPLTRILKWIEQQQNKCHDSSNNCSVLSTRVNGLKKWQ